jgi:hypothetical protein
LVALSGCAEESGEATCAPVIEFQDGVYGSVGVAGELHLGTVPIGEGVIPGCDDSPEPPVDDMPVAVVGVRGVSSSVAIGGSDGLLYVLASRCDGPDAPARRAVCLRTRVTFRGRPYTATKRWFDSTLEVGAPIGTATVAAPARRVEEVAVRELVGVSPGAAFALADDPDAWFLHDGTCRDVRGGDLVDCLLETG